MALTADLLDVAPCGFFEFDDDGTILYANAGLHALLEIGALAGRHIDSILAPGARIFYQTHVFPLLRLHGRVDEIYLSLHAQDGTTIPVLLNAVRREPEARPVNDAVVVPMRRRNQFESELLQAKHTAEEANRARKRFLSVLSHDLRAPLSAINLASTLLAQGGSGPVTESQRSDLNRITEASTYVLRLMTDLLNFSSAEMRRTEIHPQPLPLESVISRATEMVHHLAAKAQLHLERLIHDPVDAVLADPERLQQILLNLLTNAIKFTAPGGRITIATERTGDALRFHVQDTGSGISEDDLSRIFDPFVQLNRPATAGPREGVGLGLAISRELAYAMRGDLTAASEVGAGTIFTLTLPAAPPSHDENDDEGDDAAQD